MINASNYEKSLLIFVCIYVKDSIFSNLSIKMNFKDVMIISFSYGFNMQVIGKLTEGKTTHVPFRDSKLTRLLQSSLSGHGHVSVRLFCIW